MDEQYSDDACPSRGDCFHKVPVEQCACIFSFQFIMLLRVCPRPYTVLMARNSLFMQKLSLNINQTDGHTTAMANLISYIYILADYYNYIVVF